MIWVSGSEFVLVDEPAQDIAPSHGSVSARHRAFPPDAGSLLLGLLAATQTGLPPAGEHGLTRGSLLPSTSSHYTVPHAAGHKESRLGAPAEAVDGMRRPDLPEGSPGGRADPNVARHGRRTSSAPSRPGGHGRGAFQRQRSREHADRRPLKQALSTTIDDAAAGSSAARSRTRP